MCILSIGYLTEQRMAFSEGDERANGPVLTGGAVQGDNV
jgi:hypothetical protein